MDLFLEEDGDSLRLKEDYAYYYQLQLQMKMLNMLILLFGRRKTCLIPMEKEFIDDAMDRAAPFVKLAILPELVGKWFTRQKTSLSEEQTTQQYDVTNEDDEQVWSY